MTKKLRNKQIVTSFRSLGKVLVPVVGTNGKSKITGLLTDHDPPKTSSIERDLRQSSDSISVAFVHFTFSMSFLARDKLVSSGLDAQGVIIFPLC